MATVTTGPRRRVRAKLRRLRVRVTRRRRAARRAAPGPRRHGYVSWVVAALVVAGLSPAAASERTEQELNCLALNIYHEARNQPLEGQLAVAHVTLNRAEARGSATICEAVYRGWSFSWTRDPRKQEPPNDRQAWDIAKAVARWALSDRDSDPVGGSTFFHAASVEPDWAPAMERVRQIGDHIFYRDAAVRDERLAQEPGETR